MRVHASCVAKDGAGLLLLGPSGCGKSDLALRLLDRGFLLVADDCVDIECGIARSTSELAGLLEVRGLGIIRVNFLREARLALALLLPDPGERLPERHRHALLHLPTVALDPWTISAAQRAELALACALGSVPQHAGAFAP